MLSYRLYLEAKEKKIKAPWDDGKPLLTWGELNPKTAKNSQAHLVNPQTGKGYYTAVLHLSPANESGFQACPWHTPGCASNCLHFAGDPQCTENKMEARWRRTLHLALHPDSFLQKLYKEIEQYRQAAHADDKHLAVRLNATSDVPWEAGKYNIREEEKEVMRQVMHHFPDVYFYDYTKSVNRANRHASKYTDNTYKHWPDNYHITYSLSEHPNSREAANKLLEKGVNVSIPFGVHRKHDLPKVWVLPSGKKVPIIDGDKHDLRFLDVHPAVVGLRAKGDGLWDTTSGFIIQPEDPQLQDAENYEWIGKAIQWRINRRKDYLANRRRVIRQNRTRRSQGEDPVPIPGGPLYHRRRAQRLQKQHARNRADLMEKYKEFLAMNPSRDGLPRAEDDEMPYRKSLPVISGFKEWVAFSDLLEMIEAPGTR